MASEPTPPIISTFDFPPLSPLHSLPAMGTTPSNNRNDDIKQLEGHANLIKTLGTELSKRISAFERWLDRLPGKIEVSCSLESGITLRFHRSGKNWILSVGVTLTTDPFEGGSLGRLFGRAAQEWTPLSDCNLERKLLAVEKFPELVTEMCKKQAEFLSRLGKAHEKFDAFAKTIGMNDGEGK